MEADGRNLTILVAILGGLLSLSIIFSTYNWSKSCEYGELMEQQELSIKSIKQKLESDIHNLQKDLVAKENEGKKLQKKNMELITLSGKTKALLDAKESQNYIYLNRLKNLKDSQQNQKQLLESLRKENTLWKNANDSLKQQIKLLNDELITKALKPYSLLDESIFQSKPK
jgi:hypothetical protein